MTFDFSKIPLEVATHQNLYKWAKSFHQLQKRFYKEPIKLRREKQIEDFIYLNGFKSPYLITDTLILNKDLHASITPVDSASKADLIVVTDQRYSRLPCPDLIKQIKLWLFDCPSLYLCLNRHYVNINDTYQDTTLDGNFTLAITQWLKKETNCSVIDLSSDYLDTGQSFTWAIPDRHYFIYA